jgi:hypothetical protein
MKISKSLSGLLLLVAFNLLVIVACNVEKDKKTETVSTPFLWKDVKADMSFDEVNKLYPSSEIIKRDDAPENLLFLQYDGVVIQKENFSVIFIFEDQKLVAVSLIIKNELYKSYDSDNLTYLIGEELTLKYDDPIDEIYDRIPFHGSINKTIWNKDNVIITLTYFVPTFWTDTPVFIEIYYTSGNIEKEDNL